MARIWADFRLIGAVVKDEGENTLLGWLLIERVKENDYRVSELAPSLFENIEEVKDFLEYIEADV